MVPTLRVVTHSMTLCVIRDVAHAVRLCGPQETDGYHWFEDHRISHRVSHSSMDAACQSNGKRGQTYSPMSSFHSSGLSAMNCFIRAMQVALCTTSTCTPRERSSFSSPMNVSFSPT